MIILHDPAELQRTALAWRAAGEAIAVVPTMGALHAGHYALIDEARRRASRTIVTLFVNPKQFAPTEDLAKYPRTFEADAEGCRARGVDLLFGPAPDAMYPLGFQTHVAVESLTQPLDGAARPGHFQGVTTVVAKLFMLAQPTVAIFGWKDAQQFLILRRMVRDLSIPVEMIALDTVREPDGLALSSRNAYLTHEERAAAPSIYAGLCAARAAFDSGESDAAILVDIARDSVASSPAAAMMRPDYIELRALDTLAEQSHAELGNSLLAVAVRLPSARLIDNIRL